MASTSYTNALHHQEYMLNEHQEVLPEERSDTLPMTDISSNRPGHTRLWSAGQGEDDDEYDADEHSGLNRHNSNGHASATRLSSTSSTGLDRNGDGGENGHRARGDSFDDGAADDIDNEKSFKYYKELPDHTKLYDAKKRSPGFRAIGGGLILLAGMGYLIAYLCTSVSLPFLLVVVVALPPFVTAAPI